jgi:hypothetical protein
MSPTQRTLAKARKEGYYAEILEHWVPFPPPGHRKDPLGFIDVLILKGPETIAVQTTSGSNLSARLTKIKAEPRAARWLEGGTRRIVIHGWQKTGLCGKVKHWTCREMEVTADMLPKPQNTISPILNKMKEILAR